MTNQNSSVCRALAWLAVLSLSFLARSVRAQDVASIPWRTGGFTDVGAGYDMLSGTPMRTVIDFEVPGSVGKYPLRLARTLVVNTSTESGLQPGPMSQWIFDFHYTAFANGGSWHVRYPNGTRASQANNSFGLGDRITSSGPNPLILLADGGRVEFTKLAGKDTWVGTRIVDPFGVALTITPQNEFGPARITDASGRFINFTWSGNGVTEVTSSATQRVTYSLVNQVAYNWPLISRADYSDGTRAIYTYSGLNQSCSVNLPQTFDDVRAVSKMQIVRYTWRRDSLSQFCTIDSEIAVDDAVVTTRRGGAILAGSTYFQDLPSGETSSYTYQGTFLIEKKDFLGNTWKYDYDARGFLDTVIDPNGGVATLVNAANSGKPLSITYADGSKVSYTYTSTANPYHLATKTDERGNVTRFERHSNNALAKVIYPDGTSESWNNLNAFAQPGEHVLRNGGNERFEYDSMGRVVRHWLPHIFPFQANLTYSYYGDGHAWEDRVRTVTDALGRATTYEYDVVTITQPGQPPRVVPRSGRGLITKITYPDGSLEQFRYTNHGKVRLETDELGNSTTTLYDAFQRVQTVTDAMGRVTTYDYKHKSNLSALAFTNDLPARITLPSGKAQVMTYDAKFRLLSKTEGSGAEAAVTSFAYDSRDNLTQQTDPVGRVTAYAYDARNRLTRQTDPGNLATRYVYDLAGNVTRVTYPNITFTSSTYDSMNKLLTQTDELGRVTTYDERDGGLTLRITDAGNRTFGFFYDYEGRVLDYEVPNPGGGVMLSQSLEYDLGGNLVRRTDARGVVTTIENDFRGREVTRNYSDGTPTVVTIYDAAGRITEKRNSVSVLTYTYDDVGRMLSERQRVASGPDKTISYTYDVDGNRTGLSSPEVRLSYSHTTRNQVQTISDPGGISVTYAYAKDGQVSSKTFGNGTSTTFSYDTAGRLSQINESSAALDWAFEYDTRNRKTRATGTSGMNQLTDIYTYNADSSLTQHRSELLWAPPQAFRGDTFVFRYDASGNRTSATGTGTYTTNLANQYTRITEPTTETFAYDLVGNMTRRNTTAFTYDGESRLLGRSTHTLRYDPLGRLVKSGNRSIVYDGDNPIAWYDTSNNRTDTTYWGAKPSEGFTAFAPQMACSCTGT